MPKAPASPPAKWTPMVLPYKGIDRSVVHALRPPGTTDFAENVRLTCPRTGRKGLARRSPWTKLWTSIVGDASVSGGNTINHLAVLPVRGEGSRTVGGRYVTVTDDFAGLLTRGTAEYASDLNRRTAGTNRDLVGFRRDYFGGSPHYVKTFVQQRVQNTETDISPDLTPLDVATSVDGGLVVSWVDSSAGGYPGVAIQYQCKNDVTVQMYASKDATTGGNGAGAQGECTGYGPFIRASSDLSQCIGACLTYISADVVRLEIIKINGATRSLLSHSDPITLANTGWTGAALTTPDLFVRIHEEGGNIRAVCSWKSAGVGAALTPGDVIALPRSADDTRGTIGGGDSGGSSGSGTSDGDEAGDTTLTCSTADSSFLGNTRAGMAALFTSGGTGSATTVDDRWFIRSITYTKIIPPDPNVLNECSRTSLPFTPGRYFLPLSTVGVGITTAGVMTSDTGGWVAAGDDLTGITHPYIDIAWPVVKGNTDASRSSYILISPLDPSVSVRYHPEVRGRYDPLTGLDSGSDTEDIAGAVLRAYTDFKSCVLVEVMHGASTGDETDPYLGKAHQDNYTEIRFVGVANGARTVLETYAVASQHMPPFHAANWQRWEDGGQTTLAATVVTWKINGMVMRTFPALSSMSGWGTFNTALAALTGRTTYMNTSKLCGIAFRGNDAPPPNFNCYGGRIVDASAETNTQRTLGNDTSLLIAFTSGRVSVGSVSGGVPSVLGSGLLFNSSVRSAFLGPILYVTDGSKYYFLDGTSSQIIGIPEWTATTGGTIPPGCSLIASWRGSIVLARQEGDTTAYFISGVLDPFWWDYGADPDVISAFAGTSSAQGQPAQPITALMPFGLDVLLIGCVGQILAMQGDPRTGGQLVVAEPNIGVIGPDAWCFDDKGILYFVSGSGLYRMVPGGTAQNVDQGRMGSLLYAIDASAIQVLLRFNPIEKCVYIFLTTTATGTACRHIVYDVEADAFVEDRYDGGDGSASEMNPWAAVVPLSSVPEERVIYMGGTDGWVRRLNDGADNDDRILTSVGISSAVDIYAPDSSGTTEVMIEKLRLEGATGSDTVSILWFTANAQEALAEQSIGSAVVSTTQALAGYCTPISIRQTGAAQKLRIAQNATDAWFLVERVAMSMSSRGRRR